MSFKLSQTIKRFCYDTIIKKIKTLYVNTNLKRKKQKKNKTPDYIDLVGSLISQFTLVIDSSPRAETWLGLCLGGGGVP